MSGDKVNLDPVTPQDSGHCPLSPLHSATHSFQYPVISSVPDIFNCVGDSVPGQWSPGICENFYKLAEESGNGFHPIDTSAN